MPHKEAFNQFIQNILSRNIEALYKSYAERINKEVGTFEDFKKFHTNSEVIGHIQKTNFNLKENTDTTAKYSGTVETDSGKTYQSEIKMEIENGEWKISEIGFELKTL